MALMQFLQGKHRVCYVYCSILLCYNTHGPLHHGQQFKQYSERDKKKKKKKKKDKLCFKDSLIFTDTPLILV